MPVATSYPGVYIEELPSTSHSVTAAPTSVTVFIGYINPFAPFWSSADPTNPPAVLIQSFADYQAYFGGFFSCPWIPDYVGQAVFQFFLNGGATAYVVPIKATNYVDPAKTPPNDTTPINGTATTTPLGTSANNFQLTALQPVANAAGQGTPMTLTISNLAKSVATLTKNDLADLTLIYGSIVETYRRLPIGEVASINTRSALATVKVTGTVQNYDGFVPTPPLTVPFAYAPDANDPPTDATTFAAADFAPVFADGAALDLVSVFNLMALPGITDATVLAEALAYCEAKRAFYIMDPPANTVTSSLSKLPDSSVAADTMADFWDSHTPPVSANGAIYFPHMQTTDPLTGTSSVWGSPPSGFVAGVFAREDTNRGVWKSPAGLETTIRGTAGVVPWGAMTDNQQGQLYSFPATSPRGINCIRTFPGIGSVVFGSRTLVSGNAAYEQWKYVAVRRTALFIEQSLYGSLGWAVEEPNDIPLWNALRQEVEAFMLGLYRQGAFQGATADKAFSVTCDDTTTTQADIDQGIVNIVVGFAPLKPAEFVVVQIAQLAGQS